MNILSNKLQEVAENDYKVLDKMSTTDNAIILCKKKEFKKISKHFGFGKEVDDDTSIVDENVRYTIYEDYNFISLLFINKDTSVHEINIYFNNKYVVIVFDDEIKGECAIVYKMLLSRMNDILKVKTAKKIIVNYIYYFFDSYIFQSSKILEKIEDEMDELEKRINNPKKDIKNIVKDIESFRVKLYTFRKYYRSLQNIYFFEEDSILETKVPGINSILYKIYKRITSLTNFSSSLYLVCNDLMHSNEIRVSNNTNKLITRLTILTVIMGIWTIVTGIFGMNFETTDMGLWGTPWGFVIVISCLIVISLIIIIILIIKKIF